jgi:hypothetical protein
VIPNRTDRDVCHTFRSGQGKRFQIGDAAGLPLRGFAVTLNGGDLALTSPSCWELSWPKFSLSESEIVPVPLVGYIVRSVAPP